MHSRSLAALAVATLLAPATAWAGRFEADAALDVFHADDTGAGDPEFITAQELGIGARLRLFELDDDLRVGVVYRGREPILGDVQNTPLRTLWEASVSYRTLWDSTTITIGRFSVPSSVTLVVDGAAVNLELPFWFTASAFAGRRGLTSARREAGISLLLPAAGGSVGWAHPMLTVDLRADYAYDEALFLKASGSASRTYGALHLLALTSSRPFDWLLLGGQLSFVQQGRYVLGPTWTEVEVEAGVVDLWNALAWVEWRPWKLFRLGYDGQFQRPAIVRSASVFGEEDDLRPEIVDPRFLDNRVTASVSPFAIGWLRGGVRHRLRPEQHELRYFASLDVDHLIPFGVYGNAQLMYEDVISFVAGTPEPDRLLGSIAVGYDDYGFDVSTGVSYIERGATPLSSRLADATTPVDLSPFVLEAQRLFFVRAAYDMQYGYIAADFERSIDDNEYRALLQVGGRMELAW